jgi:hypothetical protein
VICGGSGLPLSKPRWAERSEPVNPTNVLRNGSVRWLITLFIVVLVQRFAGRWQRTT